MHLGTWLGTIACGKPLASGHTPRLRKRWPEMYDLLVPGLSKRDKKQKAGSDVGEVYPTVKAGGPGSGCKGENCGRPKGMLVPEKEIVNGRAIERRVDGVNRGTLRGRWIRYRLFVDGVELGHVERTTTQGSDRLAGNPVYSGWRIHGLVVNSREKAEQELIRRAVRFGDLKAYGTSEGVEKAWDTRGRTSKLRFKVGSFYQHPMSAIPSKVIAVHKNAVTLESYTPGAHKQMRLPLTHPMLKGLREVPPPKIQQFKTYKTTHGYLPEEGD